MNAITEEHEKAEALANKLEITRDGLKLKIGYNYVTSGRVVSQYKKIWGEEYLIRSEYIEPGKLITLLTDLGKADIELSKVGKLWFSDMAEYVDYHFKSLNITIAENGIWTLKKGSGRSDFSLGDFAAHLKLSLPSYNNSLPKEAGVPRLLLESIPPALHMFIKNRQMSRIMELQHQLAYSSACSTDPNKYISGLFKIYFIDPSPENIAAFKHMVWTIKRYIFVLSVDNPLFYILHSSKQGTGKTTLFRKLCSGFEWIYSPSGKLSSFLHVNDYKAMVRDKNLVDFQELSITNTIYDRSGNVDESVVTALKSIITTDVISGREMYMSTDSSERKATVFVSSTNKHIWDVVNDASGMRRYWEFDMHPPKDFNLEFYLEANYYFDNILDLYRSIDEKNPLGFYHPSAPEYPEMRKIQDSYAKENPFLSFCKTNGWFFANAEETDAEKVELRKLLDRFNNYLIARGDQKWNARLVQFVVSANTGHIPEKFIEAGKIKEIYWMKGYK